MTALLQALENDVKYSNTADMENFLVECDTSKLTSAQDSEALNECSKKTHLGGSGGDSIGSSDGAGAASTIRVQVVVELSILTWRWNVMGDDLAHTQEYMARCRGKQEYYL